MALSGSEGLQIMKMGKQVRFTIYKPLERR